MTEELNTTDQLIEDLENESQKFRPWWNLITEVVDNYDYDNEQQDPQEGEFKNRQEHLDLIIAICKEIKSKWK